MESFSLIHVALRQGEWTTSLDLRDAYLHIPNHKRFRRFLRFTVGHRRFKFQVLPFGLAASSLVITRVFVAEASFVHSRDIRYHFYLDDSLLCNKEMSQLLLDTGFVWNL